MDKKENKLKKPGKKDAISINFICTGNTCRSYIAEATAIHLLKTVYYKRKPGIKNKVIIGSAGTDVILEKIPVNTYRVLEKMEIPNIKFRPSSIDLPMVSSSDLLLTMATSHKKNIDSRFGNTYANKIFTLIELANIILYLESEDIYKRNAIERDCIEVTSIQSMHKKDRLYRLAVEKTRLNDNKANLGTIELALQKIGLVKNLGTDSLIKPYSIDIEDPFGRSINIYLKVAKLIKENITTIFNYLFK